MLPHTLPPHIHTHITHTRRMFNWLPCKCCYCCW